MKIETLSTDRESISSTDWCYEFKQLEENTYTMVRRSHSGTTLGCFWTEDISYEGNEYSQEEIDRLIVSHLKDGDQVFIDGNEVFLNEE